MPAKWGIKQNYLDDQNVHKLLSSLQDTTRRYIKLFKENTELKLLTKCKRLRLDLISGKVIQNNQTNLWILKA